jgi:hypothetical protein
MIAFSLQFTKRATVAGHHNRNDHLAATISQNVPGQVDQAGGSLFAVHDLVLQKKPLAI